MKSDIRPKTREDSEMRDRYKITIIIKYPKFQNSKFKFFYTTPGVDRLFTPVEPRMYLGGITRSLFHRAKMTNYLPALCQKKLPREFFIL